LPAEAQWEYACRASTRTAFHFGETISTAQANFDGRIAYGDGIAGEYRKKTLPVGSFPENAWGLQDMHGNVWELCADYYKADYYVSSPTVDPLCLLPSDERTVRGGSWYLAPSDCRSAYRQGFNPTGKNDGIGFRVVCIFP
jgi:formylglycine-generating enzyme required for sulfatase activity